MAKAFFKAGEAEAKLEALYAARHRALSQGDATTFNALDCEIRSTLAVMRAEVNCGLREPAFISFNVEA